MENIDKKFERLFVQSVCMPTYPAIYSIDDFEKEFSLPKRAVINYDNVKGIKSSKVPDQIFHSECSREDKSALVLDKSDDVVRFVGQPLKINYRKADYNSDNNYTPDIGFLKKSGIVSIIEVKDYREFLPYKNDKIFQKPLTVIRKLSEAAKQCNNKGLAFGVIGSFYNKKKKLADELQSAKEISDINPKDKLQNRVMQRITDGQVVYLEKTRAYNKDTQTRKWVSRKEMLSLLIRNDLYCDYSLENARNRDVIIKKLPDGLSYKTFIPNL